MWCKIDLIKITRSLFDCIFSVALLLQSSLEFTRSIVSEHSEVTCSFNIFTVGISWRCDSEWLNSLSFVSSRSQQSSKCRSVFSPAQKIEGFRRLDRQLAHFNDYNFVFTSYAKNRPQNQSWTSEMKKRKKKLCGCEDRRSLVAERRFLCVESSGCRSSLSLTFTHSCTYDVDIVHESSARVPVDILAHSCCDLEVHVEFLNLVVCVRHVTPSQYMQCSLPFLQVSPRIPHRQGFRPH